jgi:hypothetical protein
MAACHECSYFDDTHCRYNPPVLAADYGLKGCWPRVRPDDWCGRYSPRETQPDDGNFTDYQAEGQVYDPNPPWKASPSDAERNDPWTDIGYTRPATTTQKED